MLVESGLVNQAMQIEEPDFLACETEYVCVNCLPGTRQGCDGAQRRESGHEYRHRQGD